MSPTLLTVTLFINGAMRSINPADETLLQEYEPHAKDTVEHCLQQAHQQFQPWGFGPLQQRLKVIENVENLLQSRIEELATLMTKEMGKPVKQARAEVKKCAWACRYYVEHAEEFLDKRPVSTDAQQSYVRYEPLGVILGIMPWNYPLWQVIRACIPALTTGNTFILKHAPNVCGCALACEKLFQDAGAPTGVFTTLLVDVDTTSALIADDRVAGVTLTGSTRAGRAVAEQAGLGIKPVVLELGGSDPFIVLQDADLDRAVETAVKARFTNNGQSCIAAKRWIIEAPVYDLFVRKAAEAIRELTCDAPIFESTDVGPLARADLLETLEQQVAGTRGRMARCVVGGSRTGDKGFYFEPTLLAEVEPGMPCFDEETFGPVAAAIRAEDEDHAIELANQTPYGLGAAIWTKAERAQEFVPRIRSGHLAVNGMTKSDPRLPFGGIKNSGIGRELSMEGQHAFANIKTVWIGE